LTVFNKINQTREFNFSGFLLCIKLGVFILKLIHIISLISALENRMNNKSWFLKIKARQVL